MEDNPKPDNTNFVERTMIFLDIKDMSERERELFVQAVVKEYGERIINLKCVPK